MGLAWSSPVILSAATRPSPPHTPITNLRCILPLPAQISGPNDATEFTQADLVSSKFSFTADIGGSHKICFSNGSPQKRTVELDWASGAAAIDYSDVAKVEQLKPLELEMRKLEDRLAAVRKEMQFQREREEAHRDSSESTASRVMWFSLLTIAIVVVQGALQVHHMWTYLSRNKFQVKKSGCCGC